MENRDILYSPFNETLPIELLEEAFQYSFEESKNITSNVCKKVMRDSGFDLEKISQGTEKMRLVVDFDDKGMDDYKNGVIKLAREKGNLVAQIKNNGKYGEKLPIKEEVYLDGPNSLEVMNAFQLQNIADCLERLSEKVQAIDENVKDVLKGLQNDRLGLYYSGVSLYCEAKLTQNQLIKEQLILQSLKTLSDANYQLILNIQSDINYLRKKEYTKDKKNQYELMTEKVSSINKSFSAIHYSMLMKAAIYCELGEINAMIFVFKEYSSFIKQTIVPNAKLLTQCDVNDTGKLDGTWSKRALLLDGLNNVVNQLSVSHNEIYIEYKGEDLNESF